MASRDLLDRPFSVPTIIRVQAPTDIAAQLTFLFDMYAQEGTNDIKRDIVRYGRCQRGFYRYLA
jgi:hypothetical protein